MNLNDIIPPLQQEPVFKSDEVISEISNEVNIQTPKADAKIDFFDFIKQPTTSPNIKKIEKGIKETQKLNEIKEIKDNVKEKKTLEEVISTKEDIKKDLTEDELDFVSELFVELLEYINKLIAKKIEVIIEPTTPKQKERLKVATTRVLSIMKIKMHPAFTLVILIAVTYGFKYMSAKPDLSIKREYKKRVEDINEEENETNKKDNKIKDKKIEITDKKEDKIKDKKDNVEDKKFNNSNKNKGIL